MMRVEQIMSRPVAMCRSSDSLHSAARLMWDHDCGALPVTDDDGKLVGMVTDRDICMATYTQGRAPQTISVWDAMAKQVFSCHAADSLEAAEHLMGEKQVRRVPVVDDGNRPIGLLSMNDLARQGASSKKKDAQYEVLQTMATICQPRSNGTEQPSAV
jgi:CBS domain-containing protein